MPTSVPAAPNALKQIGANIRRQRKARRWTQERLAEETGLSAYFIGSVERGQAALSLRSLDLIAKALRLPLGLLVHMDEEEDRKCLMEALTARMRKMSTEDLRLLHQLLLRL